MRKRNGDSGIDGGLSVSLAAEGPSKRRHPFRIDFLPVLGAGELEYDAGVAGSVRDVGAGGGGVFPLPATTGERVFLFGFRFESLPGVAARLSPKSASSLTRAPSSRAAAV